MLERKFTYLGDSNEEVAEEEQEEGGGSNSEVKIGVEVDKFSSDDESCSKEEGGGLVADPVTAQFTCKGESHLKGEDEGSASRSDIKIVADQNDHSSSDSDLRSSTEKNLPASMFIHTQRSFEIDSTNLSVANKVIKEGNDLKDKADSLKKSGSELDGTNTSLQAALKFLRGGFLLESCNLEGSRSMYMEAAKLCKSVADEYEKRNESAVTALAYKCMEAAYMRIVSNYVATSNDCHELQKNLRNTRQDSDLHNRGTLANVSPSKNHDSGSKEDHIAKSQDRHELQMSVPNTPQGGTPLSLDCDDDSLHNRGKLANVSPSNSHDSENRGDHIIVAENVPKFVRVLNHVKICNMAMESVRKCQEAVAKIDIGESKYAEAFPHVQRVVDLSFDYIDELICLMQLAIQALKIDN